MPTSALAGLSLLVLGESHMSLADHLLEPLHDNLTRQGALVHSIGACGASASDWLISKKVDCGAERKGNDKIVIKGREATTTPIQDLIAADKPDLVVLVIGDTMASYDKPVFMAKRHRPGQGHRGHRDPLRLGGPGLGQSRWHVPKE